MPNNCYHICTYPTVILLFDALSLIILKAAMSASLPCHSAFAGDHHRCLPLAMSLSPPLLPPQLPPLWACCLCHHHRCCSCSVSAATTRCCCRCCRCCCRHRSKCLGLPIHFLFCQNTFCFHLLGLSIRIREKLWQGYIQKSFLIIGNYKKIWNRAKIFFVRPQYCPPSFPNPVSSSQQNTWFHYI